MLEFLPKPATPQDGICLLLHRTHKMKLASFKNVCLGKEAADFLLCVLRAQ